MEEDLYLVFNKYVEEGKVEPYGNGDRIVYDIKTYLKYLEIVVEEIKKIKTIVKEFPESEEKEILLLELDCAIRSFIYFKNNYDSPIIFNAVDPEILMSKNYVKANYYVMDKNEGLLNESPSTIVFEKNLQFVYIIEEKYSIIPEEGEEGFEDYNDEFNIGYQEMSLYGIDKKKNKIYRITDDRIAHTDDAYFYARRDMSSMIGELLKKLAEPAKEECNDNRNIEMIRKLKNNQ